MTHVRKKLIEVALPLDAINAAAAREKSIRHGHPSTLHLWWARRPLAAARAVLFGQLVDDPSAWPEGKDARLPFKTFPTAEAQEAERKRLFGVIEKLVLWESSNDADVINAARFELARSWARREHVGEASTRDREAAVKADPDHPPPSPQRIFECEDGSTGDETAPPRRLTAADVKAINDYLARVLPAIHDPFAGGGTIPLEAQRLGLRAIASDLNPVAVLINKALIEIPPRFAGKPPVNPEAAPRVALGDWSGARGLADDVRYYGRWMRGEAEKRIGKLYPKITVTADQARSRPDLKPLVGQELTVIAWLWARTVASPNPALRGAHVPLVSSFWLSKKEDKQAWVEPVTSKDGKSYRFEVRTGRPKDAKAVEGGTKLGRGANFRCVLSETPIAPEYIKAEGKAGRMGARLLAIVAEGTRGRVYLDPLEQHERIASKAKPSWAPEQELPQNPRWFSPPDYGMPTYGDLFTARQLTALTTFSDLVGEARYKVLADAQAAKLPKQGKRLHEGGQGAEAYADAVATYLGLALGKAADRNTTLCSWESRATRMGHTFSRQALPMVWDYVETNLFAGAGGDYAGCCVSLGEVLDALRFESAPALARQAAAQDPMPEPRTAKSPDLRDCIVISTDPPYYDNIGYADLSDFFYVWQRRTLAKIHPDLFRTMLVPKAKELVASPYRHGGKKQAEAFFLTGMSAALERMAECNKRGLPATIYYAFKQSETDKNGTASTGWETFLDAALRAGFALSGTWPTRTELGNRMNGQSTNALASSIVLVCRTREEAAGAVTRAEFRRELRAELPAALASLQRANIAAVDVAQASIGPGMAIFSRYAQVLEADGSAMTVRTALQLINEALDEHLNAQEGEADSDTRFAVTWYEQHGFESGAFGEAETLAKARNVSVAGIVEAGIARASAGKVRLLKRSELPAGWDPTKDTRPTVWEATQHLIKRAEEDGEQAAAALFRQLGSAADQARDLAYRLYNSCERRNWAEEARAYNSLIVLWPELEKLAQQRPAEQLTFDDAKAQRRRGLRAVEPATEPKPAPARGRARPAAVVGARTRQRKATGTYSA